MIFPSIPSIAAGLFFGIGISFIAYKFKSLSMSGAVAAAILGTIVFGLGGLAHTAVLLTFFISSSFLSRLFNNKKKATDEKYAKGSRRDAGQVLANGGVAGICVILGLVFPDNPLFSWMYCAAFAAANADTWATELGVFSKHPPRLITTFKQVEMGTSGGVTLLGTISALAGAGLIGGVVFLFFPFNTSILWIAIAGLFGSLVDSWLGGKLQAGYFCPVCKKETEKHPRHGCGAETLFFRGVRWLDNDWVNLFCTLSAALFVGIVYLLL
jgi:uncharacterized protein (TIGR00297 family)